MANIRERVQKVRDELDKQGRDLSPEQWKEMLEELATDIDGHLDAIREEGEEGNNG